MNRMLMCGSDQYLGCAGRIKQHEPRRHNQ